MACPLTLEKVWTDKGKYDEAEKQYFERLSKLHLQVDKILPKCKFSCPALQSKVPIVENNKNHATSSKHVIPEDEPLKSPVRSTKSRRNKKKRNQNFSPTDYPESIPPKSTQNETVHQKPNPHNIPKTQPSIASKEVKEKCNEIDKNLQNSCYYKKEEIKEKGGSQCSIAGEVAKARQHIKNSLECMDGIAAMASSPNTELVSRLTNLEKENVSLRSEITDIRSLLNGLLTQVESLKSGRPHVAVCPAKPAAKSAVKNDEDEDDGVDLFASDSEEESDALAKLKEERLAAYNAKKSKKPVLIAKSNIILDIKPWDDETDMKEMEKRVREVSTDGLLWGAAKLVPLAYGIHKLQISCVVEDDKVSIDWLQEELEKIEDYVQSIDIAAFNKV